MTPRGQERRSDRRYEHRIGAEVSTPPGTVSIETVNISAGGALCLSSSPIPLMTRLRITLFLPSDDGREATLLDPLVMNACVVRCEPAPDTRAGRKHLLAVFFTEVSDEDRAALERYLARRTDRDAAAH